MAVVKPALFQIVGFQDSGKTTFVKKLLQKLVSERIRAVTIKHHGHGGKPDLVEDKDSAQHTDAGAIASLVEGEGRLIIQAEKTDWTIEEKIALLLPFQPDVIVIEGHKFERFAKGVIIRRKEEVELLTNLENIHVIYYWDEALLDDYERPQHIQAFHISDEEGLQWLVSHFCTLSSTKKPSVGEGFSH